MDTVGNEKENGTRKEKVTSKNHNLIHYTKEQEVSRISSVLKQVVERTLSDVRESYLHREPMSVRRKSYLRVEFPRDNDGHEDGYSIEYDPCTYDILKINWFSTKNGVYQEVPLTEKEARALDKYYHFSDDLPYHATCDITN